MSKGKYSVYDHRFDTNFPSLPIKQFNEKADAIEFVSDYINEELKKIAIDKNKDIKEIGQDYDNIAEHIKIRYMKMKIKKKAK